MKCDLATNAAYFRGELSLAEIDCQPWDSNYVEPEPEPIDVSSQIVGGIGEGRDARDVSEGSGDDREPVDDTTATEDKTECPCTAGNPLLWLAAGVAIGYMMRE